MERGINGHDTAMPAMEGVTVPAQAHGEPRP